MGRKFIPVNVNSSHEKVYMADVKKIYKFKKKIIPQIPIFIHDCLDTKESSNTSE